MEITRSAKKDLFFTSDHEWIEFQGSVARIGICPFKLSGFKKIDQVVFFDPIGYMKKGGLIATIKYNDYIIDAHMPVDGKVISVNDTLLSENKNILLQYPESDGWIALITPSQPYERKGLLVPSQYQMKGRK
jgi:glycine cleavage system H protein